MMELPRVHWLFRIKRPLQIHAEQLIRPSSLLELVHLQRLVGGQVDGELVDNKQEKAMKALWDAAIRRFKNSTERDDQKLAEVIDELTAPTSPGDPEPTMTTSDLATFIEKLEDEMKREGIRGKVADFFQRAIPIVNAFGVVGDVAVSCNPNPAALPWAAVRLILLNLTAGTEIRNKLVDSIAKITTLFFQCTTYQGIYLASDTSIKTAGMDQESMAHLRATIIEALFQSIRFLCYAIRHQRLKKRHLTAAFKLPDVMKHLADLDDIGKRLFQAGDDCEQHCNQQNRATVQDMYKLVVDLGQALQEARDLRADTELATLLAVPGAAFDRIDNQADAFCYPGTRVALLKEVSDWAHDSPTPRTFWLQGLAGTGKSTICRTVARKLKHENILAASFFFKKGVSDRNNGSRMFPTIAYQLARALPSVRRHICDAIKHDPDSVNAFMDVQLQKLILNPLLKVEEKELPKALVIVIDALDECEDLDHRRTILNLLTKSRSEFLKVFMTSRPELDLRTHFKLVEGQHQDLVLHHVDPDIIEQDIHAVLKEDVEEFRREHNRAHTAKVSQLPCGWPGGKLHLLVKMSVPLFIAAATFMRMLKDPDWAASPDEKMSFILESSENTSSEYERLYNPVLKRMLVGTPLRAQSRFREKFAAIVGPIILLANPLSATSLAILLDKPLSDINSQLIPLHTVLDVPDGDGPIRIFHLSFRDFLLGELAGTFKVAEGAVHARLATCCLELMSTKLKEDICELGSPGASRMDVDEATIKKHLPPEVQYACCYWIHHFTRSENRVQSADNAYKFLRNHFQHWLEVLILMGRVADSIGMVVELQGVIDEQGSSEFSKLLYDAWRFIRYFRAGIEDTPLQLYCSGAIFAPTASTVPQPLKERRYPEWITQRPVVDSNWTACLQILEGHDECVIRIAFLPDDRLASVSEDGTIKVWDPASGSCLWTLRGHRRTVPAICCWENSKLASSSTCEIHEIKIWDLEDGTCLQTLTQLSQREEPSHNVAFSDDGKHLCGIYVRDYLGFENGEIYDLAAHKCVGTFRIPGSNDPFSPKISISRKNQMIAVPAGEMALLSRWTVAASGDLVWRYLTGHVHQVHSVEFSADGALLASASLTDIKIWDTRTDTCLRTLRAPGEFMFFGKPALTWNRLAVQLTDARHQLPSNMAIYNPNAAPEKSPFCGFVSQEQQFNELALSVGGGLLASISCYSRQIGIFDPAASTPNAVEKPEGPGDYETFFAMAFGSDSNILVSSTRARVKIFDPSSGAFQKTLKIPDDRRITSVVVAKTAPLVAVLSRSYLDSMIQIWNLNSGNGLQTIIEKTTHIPLRSHLSMSADGGILTWIAYNFSTHPLTAYVEIWDLRAGRQMDNATTIFGCGWDSILAAYISPSGEQIATARTALMPSFIQLEIQSLSASNRRVVLDPEIHASKSDLDLMFSPNGQRLAAVVGDEGRIWSTETGQCLWQVKGWIPNPWHNTSLINFELECPLDQDLPVPQPLEALVHPYHLDEDGRWIMKHTNKLLWVPPQYTPYGPIATSVSISGSTLAIGTRSGQVILIGLDYL